ncbi:beta-agarase [Seonamhaeicola algicola]|uniref:Beta-agarase n=2 Tax=Seonamhaeicola algicola TaxID=1719036 RepID=A0A5C7ATV0_9FLAO|nr:beta-agarase [Seonamhaeicola algicola]
MGIFIACSCSSSNDETVNEQPQEETPKPNPEAPEETEEETTNQTYADIEVPANAGNGMVWQFQEDLSDDFEYEYAGNTSLTTFGNDKWTNFYHNAWNGPGPTIWKHENVTVSGGNLRLLTTRVEGETKTYSASNGNRTDKATRLGCITSTKRVKYPVFVEARVKVANAFFASDIWMLSPDDTQEIDILEAYGAQDSRNEQTWFSERFHISHHVFIRQPFQDYQPKDASTWQKIDGYPYTSSDWVRIGIYWKSPTYLEYYINGNLIKVMDNLDTVGGKDGIDPLNYTSPTGNAADRTGLNKEMDIIINAEVQNWNAEKGRMPTDEDIKNRPEDHTLKVDWIRVFKPVTQ